MKKADYLLLFTFFTIGNTKTKMYLPPAFAEQLEEQNSPQQPEIEQPIIEQQQEPLNPESYEEQIPTGSGIPQQPQIPEYPQFDPSMGVGMEAGMQYNPSQANPSMEIQSSMEMQPAPTGPQDQYGQENIGGY